MLDHVSRLYRSEMKMNKGFQKKLKLEQINYNIEIRRVSLYNQLKERGSRDRKSKNRETPGKESRLELSQELNDTSQSAATSLRQETPTVTTRYGRTVQRPAKLDL
ncbi:hypothetical protein LAZ67_7001459 [Cordylochernes scorpioides]|uniref:Uncharacterized protein n=1 Tax=Cordylochernes scorpioides TaxID=51811 RepID=A0ABY6KQX9_9ARAC|nr:hypothetical protein LAZ67_7001459 [Cordylochernes scorpioides]